MKKPTKIVDETDLTNFFRERVQETFNKQGVASSELMEFYLVNLLKEFQKTEKLFEQMEGKQVTKTLAPLVAKAVEGDVNTQIRCLKELGDTALYIAGFFADSLARKPLDIDYYVGMGGTAYSSLAHILTRQKTFAILYEELAQNFRNLVDVIAEIALAGSWVTNQDLLHLYERWLVTRDEQIRELLEKAGIQTAQLHRTKHQ